MTIHGKKILQKTLKIAELNHKNGDKRQRYKLGAIILHRGKIVSTGVNKRKTHPIAYATREQELHAEMDALRKLKSKDLKGGIIFIARWRKTGPGLARPCSDCINILSKYGITKVVYTISVSKFEDKNYSVEYLSL